MLSMVVRKKERGGGGSSLAFSIASLQAVGRSEVTSSWLREFSRASAWAGLEFLSVITPSEVLIFPEKEEIPGKGRHAGFTRDLGAASGQMFAFRLN